jgi:hypothetical protein
MRRDDLHRGGRPLAPIHNANLVVWENDPLERSTHALAVIVEEKQASTRTRQDLPAARYSTPR